MPNRKNIAVLMGGTSPEREISLQSGKAIADALRKTRFNVIEIIVNNSKVDELDDYEIDVAFIALHGRFGEDGGIQEVLESKGILYTGSGVYASRLAMNKLKSKGIFGDNEIPTPDFVTASAGQDITEIIKKVKLLNMPVVVKPIDGGSSFGISIIREYDRLQEGINEAGKYGDEVLIEEYVEGRELTVSILNNTPLPVLEIKPASKFYDYDSKYKDERTQFVVLKSTEASSDESLRYSTYIHVQEMAICAHESLGCCGFSRVDMVLGKDNEVYVLEVNTIPGFTERSLLPKAAGTVDINFTELCKMIVNGVLKSAVDRKSNEAIGEISPPCYT